MRGARASTMVDFILPYKHHFFVCDAEVICALGLEPEDPDWEKIRWNCAQPVDLKAYQRLREKREKVMREWASEPVYFLVPFIISSARVRYRLACRQ